MPDMWTAESRFRGSCWYLYTARLSIKGVEDQTDYIPSLNMH